METTPSPLLVKLSGLLQSSAHQSPGFFSTTPRARFAKLKGVGEIHSFADCPFFPSGFTTENGEWWSSEPPEFPVFPTAEKASVGQGCRPLPSFQYPKDTTDLPVIIGHPGPHSAHNRAKNGNGEFRRVYRKTARECGSVAISTGCGITGISPVCTLAIGGAPALLGRPGSEFAGFQHRRQPPELPT